MSVRNACEIFGRRYKLLNRVCNPLFPYVVVNLTPSVDFHFSFKITTFQIRIFIKFSVLQKITYVYETATALTFTPTSCLLFCEYRAVLLTQVCFIVGKPISWTTTFTQKRTHALGW